MTIKVKRTGLPVELEVAIAGHAAAIAANDDQNAMAFVEERAAIAAEPAMARVSAMRPLIGVKVIARARLGSHYIVKLRLIGEALPGYTLARELLTYPRGDDTVLALGEFALLGRPHSRLRTNPHKPIHRAAQSGQSSR